MSHVLPGERNSRVAIRHCPSPDPVGAIRCPAIPRRGPRSLDNARAACPTSERALPWCREDRRRVRCKGPTMMAESPTCPICGTAKAANEPDGLCAASAPTGAVSAAGSEAPTIAPTGADAEPARPVGEFGDYELLGEIARGGMGVVFRARQVRLNRLVALKVVLSGTFAGDAEVRRFYQEAEVAAGLDHPGIVPVFEFGEHEGKPFFSMGLVEGRTLAQAIAAGPLPPRQAAVIVRQVAEAVQYAHRARRRAPRPQAGQRAARRAGPSSRDRLRHRPTAHVRQPAHRDRPDHGDAELHGPRAGPGRGGRAVRGRLCAGGDPLRRPDRPAALPGRQPPRDARPGRRRGSRAARPPQPRGRP